jgi:hypothetical protein
MEFVTKGYANKRATRGVGQMVTILARSASGRRFSAARSRLWLGAGVALTVSVGTPIPAAAQNALAQLATSMESGQWQELVTGNIGVLNQAGTDGNIITYGADAAWDPAARKLLYVGNDHIDSILSEADRFVVYDANTNAWQNMAPPPWSTPGSTDHGYYHHAFDSSSGKMYRRAGKESQTFATYHVASNTWASAPPDTGISGSSSCCSGVEYFPALGIVHAQGGEPGGGLLRALNLTTNQWSAIGAPIPTLTAGTYTYGAYNAFHKVMIFGQNAASYKVNEQRSVSQIASPPFTLYDGGGYLPTITADPVTGEYLVLTPTTRQLYTYNVTTNAWQQRSSPTKPNLANNSVIAEPIPNYGVTMYVACHATNCKVYVYKHAPGGIPPAAPLQLTAH